MYEYLQSAVYYLDVARQQPEEHIDAKFKELIKRQPKIEQLLADCGDPPELIRRRVQCMQYMLQARQAYRQGKYRRASELLHNAEVLLP